ncbi:hypothetical protein AAG570_006253 [Ranatra chinensis]|uniref:FERM domain-containing protein n=1 Tax=Ranatra chinensis TaxID=642074 RepID=A0ABD0Z696_9HEMI
MKQKSFHVYVHHLDGELSIEIGVKRKGRDLFDLICQRLSILENWYFGIQYENRGQLRWIKMKRSLSRQIGRGKRPVVFLVKHFPEDIALVEDPTCRRLVYEHCKREILGGQRDCSPETCVLLASYALQADYGDWHGVDYAELSADRLVPKRVRSAYGTNPELWAASVLLWHKDHAGMSRPAALVEYMKVVQNTTDYGIHYYPVTWVVKPVWLGVTARGIEVYGESARRVAEARLRWILIRTVRFSGRKFVVTPVFSRIPDYVFRTGSKATAKEIFRLCVGYHDIYKKTLSRRHWLYTTQCEKPPLEAPLYEHIEEPSEDDYQGRHQYKGDSFIVEKLPTLFEENTRAPSV